MPSFKTCFTSRTFKMGSCSLAFPWEIADLESITGIRGRAWTDAHLAALAIQNGAALENFDRDFRLFEGLHLVEL